MQFDPRKVDTYSEQLIDPLVHTRFIRRAGIVYGFIFGLGVAVALWLPDALQLQQASAYLAWAKLPIGLIIGPLIGTLAGWIAGHTQRAVVSTLTWILAGALIAWLAGHIPYEWVSLIARLDNSYPITYNFPPFATVFTAYSMISGMLAGLVAGLLQLLVAERA